MSRRHRPDHSLPSRWKRVVATVGAGLVLLLSLSVVSPAFHAWLHDLVDDHATGACTHGSATKPVSHSDSGTDDDHTCAVTLFAQGALHQVAATVLQPCEGLLRAVNHRAFERLALAQPRYLHRPPQAPPAV